MANMDGETININKIEFCEVKLNTSKLLKYSLQFCFSFIIYYLFLIKLRY